MTIQIKKTTVENNVNINRATLKQKVCNNDNSIYQLLIITPKKFAAILQPLVNHKNSLGVSTRLVTLTEVYDHEFWGRDEPEKIKYFIRDAIENWGIKYVLLVGSFKYMPVRYVYNDESEGYLEPYYISELYYADIYDHEMNFSSWDGNNNGVFGEWKGETAQDKDIDLRPDVYVGRLACRNNFEVKIMVNKIINYETRTYNTDWFKRFVVVSGDTYPDGQYDFPTPGCEGEENTLRAIENMTDFTPVKLWVSDGSFTGPKDVRRTINQGCSLMFFDGHASPVAWGTHPEGSYEFQYGLKNTNMFLLRNGYKLPVVVAGACHNAQFDVTPLNLLEDFKTSFNHGTYPLECWAWKFTSQPIGGSIATIANTGLGMTKEDKESQEGAGDFMDLQFFYVYGNKQTDILGEVWGKAIERYLDHFPIDWNTPSAWDFAYDAKTVQQWVLLGDPSLKIGGYEQNSSILSAS
jgi:hypothetical protein